MADQKISAMPSAATLTGAELVPLVQGGANVTATLSSVSTFTRGYGSIYVAGGATSQTTSGTANSYTQVTAFATNGVAAGGVTPVVASDKITLAAGVYSITFNASFTATNNHNFAFRCFNSTASTAFVNTVVKNHTQSTDPHQVGFSAIISIASTSDVIVQVASTSTSQPFTITDANFIAVAVG
jgi:hypothetical protein